VFEWDSRKAQANLAKHGVPFDEAVTVFYVETIRTISARQASRRERKAYAPQD
jgi:uncharacterized DUF497 family protein